MNYIDIHTHRKHADSMFIRNAIPRLPLQSISNLRYKISIGFHPWYLNRFDIENVFPYLKQACTLHNVVAIGETGFDRSIDVEMKRQQIFFEMHIAVAREYNKPVIVHCVRGYDLLLPYFKEDNLHFVLHAYHTDVEMTKKILHYNNVYFSFGQNLLHKGMGEKQKRLLKLIPMERIFFETDNSGMSIEKIYHTATQLTGVNTEQWITATNKNYNNIFVH